MHMENQILPRHCSDLAHEVIADTPVLSISGARQVGKSTLAKQLLAGRDAKFVNLDDSTQLLAAQQDPDGFVRQYPNGILAIDEIQRAPQLFRAIKGTLEEDRKPGRFIITGSSNLLSLRGAEESLAGRAYTLKLRGFSQGERAQHREDFASFAWSLHRAKGASMPSPSPLNRQDYINLITTSSFPEIAYASERKKNRWVSSYVERVLTKDASELYGIQYPDRLLTLLNWIAAQGTTEFVAAHVGRKLDIPERSIPSYLQALTSVFLVDAIPAWGTNVSKRIISKPKVFLQDSAMAASLAGLNSKALNEDLSGTTLGGILESFVAGELLKQQTWSAIDYRLFHFRTSTGKKVDLILEDRRRNIVGIEVKAAMSLSRKDFSGLTYVRDIAGSSFTAGIVLYTGKECVPMGEKMWAMPISALWNH